jgi:hypothetical protein
VVDSALPNRSDYSNGFQEKDVGKSSLFLAFSLKVEITARLPRLPLTDFPRLLKLDLLTWSAQFHNVRLVAVSHFLEFNLDRPSPMGRVRNLQIEVPE